LYMINHVPREGHMRLRALLLDRSFGQSRLQKRLAPHGRQKYKKYIR